MRIAIRCALAAALLLTVTAAAPGQSRLRRDVNALRALGVTGVMARTDHETVHSGFPDDDPYIRIGSSTKHSSPWSCCNWSRRAA